MAIDILTLLLLAIAAFKGYRRGFIVGIFSFLGVVIGIAAALKFSVFVAGWFQDNTNIGVQWLPFISFLLVMIGVIILLRWMANLLEAAIDLVLLGWLNKLGGIVFYVAINMLVYSIILFYATQMGIIKQETIDASKTYALIEPWGPVVINAIGSLFPFFKDMFHQLEEFFGKLVIEHTA